MGEKEQAKPLAPAVSYLFRSDELEDNRLGAVRRRKSYIKCCGCASAILIIVAVTLIILAFTVFHVQGPIVRVNSIVADGNITDTEKNVTLIVDVSVKNPNAASFRYKNTTTTVFYGGQAVGEGRSPAGVARARRTVRTNITVEITPAKILQSPKLTEELPSRELTMDSFTRIDGRVKIANIVKKNVVVKLNCTMTYNISSKEILRQNCKREVNI